MNFMKSHKRGITALMATFLLISLAVAVGVVIMNLGSAEVEDQAQCAVEIGLKLASIGGKEQVCYDAAKKEIKFTIENGLNIKVQGLVVNAIGTEKAESKDFSDAQIVKSGSYLGKISYDTATAGQVQQVKIVPKIVPYDVEEICTEQALVVENVGSC